MWKDIDTVLYYIDPKFEFNESVAVFSLIDTLIKNTKKLEYLYDNIKLKLIDLNQRHASIIIIHSFYECDISYIKQKMDNMISDLQIPIIAFFSTKPNRYAKPFTNIWKVIEILYNRENKNINKSLSIYVGNAAGRVFRKMSTYKKLIITNIDKSCSDRAFANNIGLTFYTPEMFFMGALNPIMWNYGDNSINNDNKKLQLYAVNPPIIKNELDKLDKYDKYIIIVTGPPSCGKTTLAEKIKKKLYVDSDINMTHISENNYQKSIESKLYSDITDALKDNSVIVDLDCYLINIQKINNIISNLKIKGLLIDINLPFNMCVLFNFIKVQNSKKPDILLKDISIFDNFYNQYIKSSVEIMSNLIYIKFPLQINISEEFWFIYTY